MLYTLTLYNIICQIYVNETVENSEEKKKDEGEKGSNNLSKWKYNSSIRNILQCLNTAFLNALAIFGGCIL